jgi:hypothetical protein
MCKQIVITIPKLIGILVIPLYIFLATFLTMKTVRFQRDLIAPKAASKNESREKYLAEFCLHERCIEPFKKHTWPAMMNYADKYGLANCAIPKSLSTITIALFCYLHDTEAFKAKNRTLTEEHWAIRLCGNKNERWYPDQTKFNNSNWTHIVVVRNPVDRFLSGFVDKCVDE